MGDVLDLDTGVPVEAPPKRGPGRPKGSTNKPPDPDRAMRAELKATLERAADWRLAVDDEELGTVLKEDAKVMTDGLMLITERLTPLRTVLVVIVAVAGPAMAFGRVARIIVRRLADRRGRYVEQQFDEQAFAEGAPAYADEPAPQI